jgi:hypothetical protein
MFLKGFKRLKNVYEQPETSGAVGDRGGPLEPSGAMGPCKGRRLQMKFSPAGIVNNSKIILRVTKFY